MIKLFSSKNPIVQLSENDKAEFDHFMNHTNLDREVERLQNQLYDIRGAHKLLKKCLTAWKNARIENAIYSPFCDTIIYKGNMLARGEYERHMHNLCVIGSTVLNTCILRKYNL